ncbi:MAG: 16S rRNA (guanine(966)-N(2))-methyltransferase RsmD [Candidatus Paracaedibacteraceae bacterium]|nr:16S rRNA (guanine(966)-N(2))-methyltransferase RsmD [Candidatus Paracaedibacteraceae bacterium]
MRIISGKLRGRKLVRPPEDITRPTTDRAREALFSVITSRLKSFDNMQVLDAFSGSGAFGLEALSRGAHHVLFAEKHPLVRRVLLENISALECQKVSTVINDALRIPSVQKPFNLIFMDPPYGIKLEYTLMPILIERGYIDESTLIIVETESNAIPVDLFSLTKVDEKTYGNCSLSFWCYAEM